MTRSLSLALVLAAGLALPALAESTIGNPFTMEDARNHLMQLGYTNVSQLVKDANGKWVGSAVKDGERVPVAVDLRGTTTN